MNYKRTGLVVALAICVGLVLFLLWKQDPAADGGKKGGEHRKPKIAGGSETSQSNDEEKDPADQSDAESGEVQPGVLLDSVSGDITLSSTGFTSLDANTAAQLRNKVRDAFARLEEIDSRHSEVVQSNLRTDVIIIGKAGEEGQKIKRELEADLLRILPKENQAAAKLIVAQVAQSTADFGSKFRAIYTQPSEGAGLKFTIGGFNDVMVKDFESFKKGGTYKDMSNASSSVMFTAPEPPFFLKKYFAQDGGK